MVNSLRPTHRTTINILKANYDKKLPDALFTRTYLERERHHQNLMRFLSVDKILELERESSP